MREKLIAQEQQFVEAVKNNDAEAMEKLLHDDLLFIQPSGQAVTKEMDLENFRSGVMKVHEISSQDPQISFIDDVATMAITYHLVADFAGNRIDADFRYLKIWKLFGNDWKIISGSGFLLN